MSTYDIKAAALFERVSKIITTPSVEDEFDRRKEAAVQAIAEAFIDHDVAKYPEITCVADLLKYRFVLSRPGSVIGFGVDRPWKGRRKRFLQRWISKIQYVDRPDRFGTSLTRPDGEPVYWPGVHGLLVYLTNGHRTTCAFIPEGEFGGIKA